MGRHLLAVPPGHRSRYASRIRAPPGLWATPGGRHGFLIPPDRTGDHLIPEDLPPVAERLGRGQDDTPPLVAGAPQVEQQVGPAGGEGERPSREETSGENLAGRSVPWHREEGCPLAAQTRVGAPTPRRIRCAPEHSAGKVTQQHWPRYLSSSQHLHPTPLEPSTTAHLRSLLCTLPEPY